MNWFETKKIAREKFNKSFSLTKEGNSLYLSIWICIYLHDLELDVSRPEETNINKALVLVDHHKGRLVVSCNTQARHKGIHKNMPLSAAYALCSDLIVKKRSPDEEGKTLHALAAWAMRFTSMVSLIPPNALVLDVKGSERLFGGLDCLKALIQKDFQMLGHQASISLAPTPTAAWMLARANAPGTFFETDVSNLTADLSDIDVGVCGFDLGILEGLRSVGLNQFSDLYCMPRDGLARRFGPMVIDFVDKALGKTADPRRRFSMPPSYKCGTELSFESSNIETLLLYTEHLLSKLSEVLWIGEKAFFELDFQLFYRKHLATKLSISLFSPTCDVSHIQTLLREKLERTTISGPVKSITLSVKRSTPLTKKNLDFFYSAPVDGKRWEYLVDKIRTRLGNKALYGLGLCDEYRPERAWIKRNLIDVIYNVDVPQSQRPIWLLPEPLPVKICSGKPVIRGLLKLSYQRERIESGWWDGQDVSRDYFIGRNASGEKFWIFRNLETEDDWYIHGVFS